MPGHEHEVALSAARWRLRRLRTGHCRRPSSTNTCFPASSVSFGELWWVARGGRDHHCVDSGSEIIPSKESAQRAGTAGAEPNLLPVGRTDEPWSSARLAKVRARVPSPLPETRLPEQVIH